MCACAALKKEERYKTLERGDHRISVCFRNGSSKTGPKRESNYLCSLRDFD